MLLREVTENDIKRLFEWANDNSVRKNAVNKKQIAWENHKKWYKSRDFGSKTHIYILEHDSECIGQIRFDRIGDNYEIDYSIDKNYRGKGYGVKIIKEGVRRLFKHVKENPAIMAKVKLKNIPSSKVLLNCGFLLINEEKHKNETYLIYELKETRKTHLNYNSNLSK